MSTERSRPVVDWISKSRITPYAHQIAGVEALLNHEAFALFDEMGAGKTKQVIDAAQVLYSEGIIDTVVVVCPAAVRSVWYDPTFGQLASYLWEGTPSFITEFHSKVRSWAWWPNENRGKEKLNWIITNYDFIRSQNRALQISAACRPKTLLVLDESSAVRGRKSMQTKTCLALRKLCGRVVLLNGTPIAESPMDMYAQGQIMSPKILDVKNFFHFRARYAIMGGFMNKQILEWRNLEDLQKRFAPYVLRRLKADCLDLPEKLPPVTMVVPLSENSWTIYKKMRDEMVAWLIDQESEEKVASVALQAGTKSIRLAQVTSGFLGGLQDEDGVEIDPNTQEIGREKLDLLLAWAADRLAEDNGFKILVWCRFRAEVERTAKELEGIFAHVGRIYGGTGVDVREHALRLLDPRTAPAESVAVVGTPASGAMGLNLSACHTAVYLSNAFSLRDRLQSEDRLHRPGQVNNVSYFDVVASGPAGQRTIDSIVLKALREKKSVSEFTTSAWISALTEES